MKHDFPWLDTHCHLDQYPSDAPGLDQADAEHIRVMSVTLCPDDFDALAAAPGVYPAVGFFPEDVRNKWDQLDRMIERVRSHRYVGEIGLDYVTKDESEREMQRKALDRILDAAAEAGQSILSLHSRRAAEDVVARFKGGFPGTPILHWFSGSTRDIESAADTCWFSINTAMVGSESGRNRIRAMPRERLLLESDGPYIEVDGGPGRPRDLVRVIQFFSGEWGQSMEDTAAEFESRAVQAGFPEFQPLEGSD